MTEADVKAHNAVMALVTFYGDMLARNAGDGAAMKATFDKLSRQLATDAKEFASYKERMTGVVERMTGVVEDRQAKAQEALRLVKTLPPEGDSRSAIDATLGKVIQLLLDMSEDAP